MATVEDLIEQLEVSSLLTENKTAWLGNSENTFSAPRRQKMDLYQSERLLYRAYDPPKDLDFYHSFHADPAVFSILGRVCLNHLPGKQQKFCPRCWRRISYVS
jgi:hypothetical protein